MDIDWDKLRVFREVSKSGSISSAASSLSESSANVSRKMTDLEMALQVQLFHRSTRGVALTAAGELALRHVETMADSAEAIRTALSHMDDSQGGAVKIVVGDGIGAHWLAPRIAKFQQANPEIQITLQVTDNHGRLPDETFDIVIQFARPEVPDLVVQRLGTMHYTFFASQHYVDVYGQPNSVFDLHRHRCIFHSGYTNQTERWCLRFTGSFGTT
ncbi:MAG: LysR family transcriptional regulator, partial [Pseudomonadota bacterium]